jgi:plastocyanin
MTGISVLPHEAKFICVRGIAPPMKRVSGIFIIAVIASTMIAGCVQPEENVTVTPIPTTPVATRTSPVAETPTRTLVTNVTETPPLPPIGAKTISITESGFSPDVITVPVGTTVIWTNDADTNQTILFTGPTGSADLGTVEPGNSISYTFTIAGHYAYRAEGTEFLGTIAVTADATV